MNWVVAENIADRIAELKEALGIRTQAELAKRAWVGKQQVGVWLRGTQQPSRQRLISWAEREGWPVAIFEEDGPMPRAVVNCTVNSTKGATEGEVRAAMEVLLQAVLRSSGPPPDIEERHQEVAGEDVDDDTTGERPT